MADELKKLHSMNAALYQENARLLQENERLRQQSGGGFAAEIATLRSQLAQLNATVAVLTSENDRLTAENVELRNLNNGAGGGDQAVSEIKRRFSYLFHPDKYSGLEKTIRQEVFKEFFGEIEKIQATYRAK